MPSEAAQTMHMGRGYCGARSVCATADPLTVAYCHCGDCRRRTGAPLPAFAGFGDAEVTLPDTAPRMFSPGVTRWNCPDCGSPLAARFDYLPGQTYVPLGLLDTAADLPPGRHCHADSAMPWLHLDDGLPRAGASARDRLGPPGTA